MNKIYRLFITTLIICLFHIISVPYSITSAEEIPSEISNIQNIWNKKTLNIYIDGNNETIKGLFEEWKEKSDNLFNFNYVKSKYNSDIAVIFTTNNYKQYGALTKYYNSDETILRAEIILPDANFDKEELKNDFKLYIIKHEIGHALGLAKHSTNPNDIMFPYKTENNQNISQNDTTRLKELYLKNQNEILSPQKENYKYDLPYLANAYKKAGQYEKAIEIYDEILKKSPDFTLAIYAKGTCYYKQGKYKESIQYLEQAYYKNNDDIIYLNSYIKALCATNNKKTAKKVIKNFLKRNPDAKDSTLINDCIRVLNK